MKQVLVILWVGGLLLLGGCSVNQDFVRGVDGYTQIILPEYKAYIAKDPQLSPDTKRIRLQSADKFQQLVDDAKLK
ncbi:MAG: hypothetical protein BZ151_03200 [Desulfobacca sp. 4484_104]|nr:MAG: hypothetical protein BZ151_03200 [Desulfobacca sp. 4484_104]RLA90767.1 MAG: hypothetical protein DRG58_01110 [Deltaproteobacteria bacterium]